MTPITVHHYLILSALLFCLGIIGAIVRKNILIIFMCLEVTMNAINLTFVTLSRYYGLMDGQVIAIFVMAIAAVEAAIGLGIVISVFRLRQTVNTHHLQSLKG